MADASDTLIQSLNARINQLTTDLATANADGKKRRLQLRAVEKERDTLKGELATITTDRDTWKGKAEADPAALQLKVDELTGQLRTRDHRDAWRDALADQLGDKVSVEDVWGKLGYKPGETVPTREQITEQLKPVRESAPFLFKTGSTPNPAGRPAQQGQKPPLQTALNPSRGAPDTAARRFEVRKSDSRNPRFMRENRQQIEDARKAGTLVFVED